MPPPEDTTPPTIDIPEILPDPSSQPIGEITIKFSEDVTGFDISDLKLRRFNGEEEESINISGLSLMMVDAQTYTLDLTSVTQIDGTYRLRLRQPEDTDIVDLADNPIEKRDTDFFTVNITNDPPDVAAPETEQEVTEDKTLTFNESNSNLISIDDPDDFGSDLKVTVSVGHGTLSLSQTTGLDFEDGDGTDDQKMTFTGSKDDINAALDGLVYTPDEDYDETDLLKVTVDDQGHTGEGGSQTDTASVSIDITPVNDGPKVETNNGAELDEGTTVMLSDSDLSASDPDDEGEGLTFMITDAPDNGTLFLDENDNDMLDEGEALGQGDSFTQADLEAGNLGYEHDDSDTTSDSFQFSLKDGGEDEAAAVPGTFDITIDAVIDGNGGNNILNGGNGGEKFRGNDGNDFIIAGAGDDIADGSDGNDRINGNNGDDELNGEDGNDRLNGGGGDDELNGGDDNDRLSGSSGDDDLNGDAGDDTLNGGTGEDDLDGGTGNDCLIGGSGADNFIFGKSFGDDEIKDFNRGIDKITISGIEDLDSNDDGVVDKNDDNVDTTGGWIGKLVITVDGNTITINGSGGIDAESFCYDPI